MMKRKNGEGSYGVKKIHGNTYRVFRYYDDSGNRKYIYGKTAKELQQNIAKMKEAKEEVLTLDPVRNSTYVFADYCDHWLKQKKGLSSRSYDDYELIIDSRIRRFQEYDIGNKQIRSLTPDMLNMYFISLSKRYARGSIKKVWTVISQVLKEGMEQRLIPEFNLDKIEIPKEEDVAVKKKDIPFATEEDIELLYQESLREKHYKGDGPKVISFLCYSGLRIGEATALRWKDVDKKREVIRVCNATTRYTVRDANGNPLRDSDGKLIRETRLKDPKSESGKRTIPMVEHGTEILDYFWKKNPHAPEDFVFQNGTGGPFTKRPLERTLERMVKNSGCSQDYTPHALRHGYGSFLIHKGVDIKIVSELLGHADVTTTYNIYIGILTEDKIKAVKEAFDGGKDTGKEIPSKKAGTDGISMDALGGLSDEEVLAILKMRAGKS